MTPSFRALSCFRGSNINHRVPQSACPTMLTPGSTTRFTTHYKRGAPTPADEYPEPLNRDHG
ncbi:hypothetical protein F1729_19405 [Gimesia maris]|nr:hypothetical protein F1729_19405 [Gimesia maris]